MICTRARKCITVFSVIRTILLLYATAVMLLKKAAFKQRQCTHGNSRSKLVLTFVLCDKKNSTEFTFFFLTTTG